VEGWETKTLGDLTDAGKHFLKSMQ
jgi:hypothetical protein